MAITNATRLADFATGIGTQGAIIKVDNANQRVGIGTTDPTSMFSVGPNDVILMDGIAGVVTATKFVGDGSELTGVISGVEVKMDGGSVSTGVTALNFSGFSTVTPVDSAGLSTVTSQRTLTIGVRSGDAISFNITGSSFNVVGRGGNVPITV